MVKSMAKPCISLEYYENFITKMFYSTQYESLSNEKACNILFKVCKKALTHIGRHKEQIKYKTIRIYTD